MTKPKTEAQGHEDGKHDRQHDERPKFPVRQFGPYRSDYERGYQRGYTEDDIVR